MERAKRSLTVRMKHEDDDGVKKRLKLEPQCACIYQGK